MGNPTGLPFEGLAYENQAPLFHNCLFKSIEREKIMVCRAFQAICSLPLQIRKSSATEPFLFPRSPENLEKDLHHLQYLQNSPISRIKLQVMQILQVFCRLFRKVWKRKIGTPSRYARPSINYRRGTVANDFTFDSLKFQFFRLGHF